MSEPTILSSLSELGPRLAERGVRSAVVLTGPSRRFADRLEAALGEISIEIVDRAAVHVPAEVVEAAAEVVDRVRPDAIISLGGGAATGLGKVLRAERELVFAAVPTTYSASEMTSYYSVLSAGKKQVSRDAKVRPELVVHDAALAVEMPLALSASSLLNALAHPISALSAGVAGEAVEPSIAAVTDALLRVLAAPRSPRARRAAFDAVARAGQLLEAETFGEHHRIAHALGGRFAAPHAGVHSVLLPHTVASLEPSLADAAGGMAGVSDLPAVLHDALVRANSASSLRELGIDGAEIRGLIDAGELPTWVWNAQLGVRPSRGRREIASGLWAAGAPLDSAERAVVAIHGRGSDAGAAIDQVRAITGDMPGVAILAPQAPAGRWYEVSYRDCDDEVLAAPLSVVGAAVDRAVEAVGRERVVVYGFSQGGCLAIELVARRAESVGGLIALSAARPGASSASPVAVDGVPVLLASCQADPWIAGGDVDATARALSAAGAAVEVLRAPGDVHEIRGRERLAARALIAGDDAPAGERGFGNSHEIELLPGALPLEQNSPRRVAYGLWAEQINGSGFVAERGHNLRSWLYRIRPATQHGDLEPLEHPAVTGTFDDRPVDPNLAAWSPRSIPGEPTDFVDGLMTVGGAGRADLRRGYAVHTYAANRSMEHRAFANADGDLMIIPQSGALTLLTELGALEVAPGAIALIPRGIKFSALVEGAVRGWVGEVFGRHFELPDRGPVGANGLTDPRHFTTPAPFFEDRLDRGYRITTKIAGALWQATQDYSPYDVVAWHGNYAPYRYDLSSFSPVGNTRFDHPDPSIYTVLSAPLDERGASSIDFVFFPPRWDPTEHTFRPPYFHRNATMEINGIIADPGLSPAGPFAEGCTFITPPVTAHGVLSRSVEAARGEQASDRPVRISDRSMWFQFESALPMVLTEWAASSPERIDQWRGEWGAYRTHYDPANRE